MNFGSDVHVDLYLPHQQDVAAQSRAHLERYVPPVEPTEDTNPTPEAITTFLETPIACMLQRHFKGNDPGARQRHVASPTIRIENLLGRIKVNTVRELLPLGTQQISRVRNIGSKAVSHLGEAFATESPSADDIRLLSEPKPADIAPYCDAYDVSLLAVIPPPNSSVMPVKRYAHRIGDLLPLPDSELEAHMREGYGPVMNLRELRSEITRYDNELLAARQQLGLPKHRVRPTNLRRGSR